MKLRTPIILAATVTALLAAASAPAFAADTATTFDIAGGTLTVANAPAASLTDGTSAAGTSTITGVLGTVTVTDARGGDAPWTATASSTAFTGQNATTPSSSATVTYTGGAMTATSGDITVAAGTVSGDITGAPAAVMAPTAVSGNNSATWDPTLNVAMPAGALADSYAGTVTTSVA